MSIPDRIVRISKAYLNQVRDRIDAELTEAERELNVATEPGAALEDAARRERERESGIRGESDAEAMMRRAEERIASARRELEARTEMKRPGSNGPDAGAATPAATTPVVPPPPGTAAAAVQSEDPNASDFRVLGVAVGSDLATVTSAYEKLARRCDPRRFPDGSAEQTQAQNILTRVNTSYETLRRRLDPTTNRFGKLEFE